QECEAGLLPVRIATVDGQVQPMVRSPRAQVRATGAPDWLDAGLACGARRRPPPPALCHHGPAGWRLARAGGAAVRGSTPDLARIAALPGNGKLAVFATGDDADLVVRCFARGVGISEDPATGSANASIAAALHQAGRLPGAGNRYVASQGREIGRDARLHLEVDDQGEAWVGGPVHAVIRGTVDW